MAFVRLSGDRVAWSGVAPSSCPEVDLEVIEEYLQEHSLEVQPARTPASPPTTVGQQKHTHSHQSTRIIGYCGGGGNDNEKDVNEMMSVVVYFYIFLPDCIFCLFLHRK